MAKRTSNIEIKKIITRTVLQERVAIWYGDETEVFAANSIEQLEDEFGVDEVFKDEYNNVVSTNWRYWWTPCLTEKAYVDGKFVSKGQKAYNKHGELIAEYEYLPLICGVYGGADDVAQVLTSYN